MTTKRSFENNITSFTLCRACQNCPVIEIHHDCNQVIITDDYGGKVTLTTEEWKQAVADVRLS
jgi:hypothetical protein